MNYKYILAGVLIAGGTIAGVHYYNQYVINHALEIAKDINLLLQYQERADFLKIVLWGATILGGALIWVGINKPSPRRKRQTNNSNLEGY